MSKLYVLFVFLFFFVLIKCLQGIQAGSLVSRRQKITLSSEPEMLLESHLLLPNGALPKSFLVELEWLLLEWVSLIHPFFLNKYMDDGKLIVYKFSSSTTFDELFGSQRLLEALPLVSCSNPSFIV